MNKLPRDILKYTLEHIPQKQLIHLTRVSKEWLDLIENHILHLETVPSLEECVITQNYFYGRRYLKCQLDEYQQQLIKIINNRIFICSFEIGKININKNNLLAYYANKGNLKVVKSLLEKEVEPHFDYYYALSESAAKGHIEIVKLLLEKGADLHGNDDYAFKSSASRGQIEMVKLLLEKGANIHADNDYALRWSADSGHIEVVKILLEKGADIHADNDHALRWSAQNGHIDIVKLLLEKGADPHADNDQALWASAKNKHLEIVKILVRIMDKKDAINGDQPKKYQKIE